MEKLKVKQWCYERRSLEDVHERAFMQEMMAMIQKHMKIQKQERVEERVEERVQEGVQERVQERVQVIWMGRDGLMIS